MGREKRQLTETAHLSSAVYMSISATVSSGNNVSNCSTYPAAKEAHPA